MSYEVDTHEGHVRASYERKDGTIVELYLENVEQTGIGRYHLYDGDGDTTHYKAIYGRKLRDSESQIRRTDDINLVVGVPDGFMSDILSTARDLDMIG